MSFHNAMKVFLLKHTYKTRFGGGTRYLRIFRSLKAAKQYLKDKGPEYPPLKKITHGYVTYFKSSWCLNTLKLIRVKFINK